MKYLSKFNESKKTEIKSLLKDFEEKYEVVDRFSIDSREFSDDAANSVKKAIKKLGGYLYDDPSYDDTDTYGYIISKKPIPKSDLNKFSKMENKLMELS